MPKTSATGLPWLQHQAAISPCDYKQTHGVFFSTKASAVFRRRDMGRVTKSHIDQKDDVTKPITSQYEMICSILIP